MKTTSEIEARIAELISIEASESIDLCSIEEAKDIVKTIKAVTLIDVIRTIASTAVDFPHCEHSVTFGVLLVKALCSYITELKPELKEVVDKFGDPLNAIEKQASELSNDNSRVRDIDTSNFIAAPPDWSKKPS